MKKFIILLFLSIVVSAQVTIVQNDDQLKDAVKNLSPGDTVVVRSGQFDTGGSVSIKNIHGTEQNRIVIKAEAINETELVGESYFDFRECSYITLEGFIFKSEDVTAVKLQASHHIRITNNIFDIQETSSRKWVLIGGIWNNPDIVSHDNRVDHNIFENKTFPGNFITIDGSSEPNYQSSQRDTIEFNLFRNNGPRAQNEKESIRVGWSELSSSSGYTVIQNNLFIDCNGDPEIISVKTCDNIVRYNTFRGCQGTLSLRHGNRTEVYGNFFFGDSVAGTGGLRIYGDDHKIYNNYFEGLTGTKWDAPLTLTNGDYDGGTNWSKHWRINRALIINNTFVNNDYGIEIGFTNNGKYSKPPRDCVIANNIVVGQKNDLVKIITNPVNMSWQNNMMFAENGASIGTTFDTTEVVEADPLLDWGTDKFVISELSPAVNSAIENWEWITEDIDGQQRVSPFDIGADEYSMLPATNRVLTLSDVGPQTNVTDLVAEEQEIMVKEFILNENYPNPFNSRTKISFILEKKEHVKIEIFNTIGQHIETLYNGVRPYGLHEFTWDAARYNSGVYFARVTVVSKVFTNKMIYLK